MLVLVPPPSDFPVKLRSATEADIGIIAALQTAAYWSNFNELEPGSHDHPGYYDKVVAGGLKDAADDWSGTTIAEIDGAAVAICILEFEPALISGLWVKPGLQDKGIGSLLIKHALERFKTLGNTIVKIDVHPRNPAVRLYQRFGFELVEATTRHSKGLGRDLPLWVMTRTI
jgi:ribosomal protein S18 acetylase RimI-like enzyme